MARISQSRKSLLFFIALAVYGLIVGLLIRERYVSFSNTTEIPETTINVSPPPSQEIELPPVQQELPAEKNLAVPFTVQAPFGVWDALHEETCEEASLLMVEYFLQDKDFSSPAETDQELKALVDWQTANGYAFDITVDEVRRVARDYFHRPSGRVISNPTVTQIKAEIAAGRPVIVPAAGQLLENPYFSGEGPPYHMIVIRGYTETEFITNDPGTRRGEEFRYSIDNLMEAMHDWTGSKRTITSGAKAVLVFD